MDQPSGQDSPIGCEAGQVLLRDDLTRADEPKEGTSFVSPDQISIYARRNNDSVNPIFNGQLASFNGVSWNYSPIKNWNWSSVLDYYDFIAVYPSTASSSVRDVAGNLNVVVSYDVLDDEYDLLGCAQRRLGTQIDKMAPMPLNFKHLLSAVRVTFENVSQSVDFTLDEYYFKYIVEAGDASILIDGSGNESKSWINVERTTSAICGAAPDSVIAPGSVNKYVGGFDLMIPQSLTEGWGPGATYKPYLVVKYTPDGRAQKTEEIELGQVKQADETTPIPSWEMGKKYTYNISLRLDGGVMITLITTRWNTTEAETPGLLI